MNNWIRKRIRVVGHVQGVGFRYFTQQQANRFGLIGFVRNMPNGEVEIDAAGPATDMDQFLSVVRQGPTASRVEQVFEQAQPLQNLSESFEIHHF